jgi:L-ascorbate metabolism protein UlaG (beta-lactamase superfamily)
MHIEQIGIDIARVTFVNAGDIVDLSPEVILEVLASAHETLETDEQDNYRHLGFVLRLAGAGLYHSGDCVPYAGLSAKLKDQKVDVALLPVNGRDDFRFKRGIPGNFTFEEAVALCRNAGIPIMICHHFGMFDFNTVDGELLRHKAKELSKEQFRCVVPETGRIYTITFQ